VDKVELQAENTQSFPQITLFTGKGVAGGRGMVRPPGAVSLKGWQNGRKTYISNFKKNQFSALNKFLITEYGQRQQPTNVGVFPILICVICWS
jgi:hypothetical protein